MSTPSPSESPSPDPLARGCTPEELAAIEAAKVKPAVQPQPVRWGPLGKGESLALRYIGEAYARGRERVAQVEREELEAHQARIGELVEAVAGRKPPLLPGVCNLGFRTTADGKTYLEAVPPEGQS